MSNVHIEPFRWQLPGSPSRILRGKVVRPEHVPGHAPGHAPGHVPGPLPYVLVLHGFKGFIDWGFFPELCRRFAGRGIAAVAFNMSGSGIGEDPLELSEAESFAANTHSKELADVEHVRARIQAGDLEGIDPSRAAILGHSRGGGTALIHAAEDGGYASVVTWAAVDSFDRFDTATKERWRAEGRIFVPNARTGQEHRMDVGLLDDLERHRSRLDPVAACARLRAPTLLLHGTADEAVSVEAVDRLAAALPLGVGEVVKVEGAGHTFGIGHPFGGPTEAFELAVRHTLAHVERGLGAFRDT